MKKMPVLFVSHGPPSILLMNTSPSVFMKSLAERLPVPKVILCVSAHWESDIPNLSATEKPDLIYDFGGPPQLFNETYPAPGNPEFVKNVLERMEKKGIQGKSDMNRGLDHGAWIPLKMIYPEAGISVVQLSIQTDKDTRFHYSIGQVLQSFREQGVLIIGSGGAVHNLYEVKDYGQNALPPEYVQKFNEWLYHSLINGEKDHLLNYKKFAPDPERSHPFPAEHFLPLFVCMGAAGSESRAERIHDSYMYGTLSMDSYRWD